MKQATIERIVYNAAYCQRTIIGQYIYYMHKFSGDIIRCKRGEENRQWIDDNGRVYSAWKIVAHVDLSA